VDLPRRQRKSFQKEGKRMVSMKKRKRRIVLSCYCWTWNQEKGANQERVPEHLQRRAIVPPS
jgi:hypothetical protein